MVSIVEILRKKQQRVLADPKMAREGSFGVDVVDLAFAKLGCKQGEALIDWGCGSGQAAAEFGERGLIVLGVDFVKSLTVDIPFFEKCLWDWPQDGIVSDYAFCVNVLEWVPSPHVLPVLSNMHKRTRKAAFIQVSTEPKYLEPSVPLHLTVWDLARWSDIMRRRWRGGEVETIANVNGRKDQVAFVCYK